jgi:nitrile hydratase accessory protein
MAVDPQNPLDLETAARVAQTEPRFAEPWQAKAFACAIHLSRKGLFSWAEWVQAFSSEIAAHPAQPGERPESAYHRQWLTTLERLVGERACIGPAEIDERTETWRRAYLNTPHGRAVELHHAWSQPSAATGESATRNSSPLAGRRPSVRWLK